MYKNKTHLEKSKNPIYWLRKKMLQIITAFMLGLSNSINEEDKTMFDNQYQIEHHDNNDQLKK
jgi:hypothetical protein